MSLSLSDFQTHSLSVVQHILFPGFLYPHLKMQLSGNRKPVTISCSDVSSLIKTSEEEQPVSLWCPLPSVHKLDSKYHHSLPFACGPIWAVQVGNTFQTLPSPQVKWKHTFKSQCNIRFSGSEASPQDDQSYGSKESLPPLYGR